MGGAYESELGVFIEHSPMPAAMFDLEMRYLHVSEAWRRDYGLGSRPLRGVSHYEVFPEIPEHWKQAHRHGLAGETLREEKDPFQRADGSIQWLRWELRPWYNPSGNIGGLLIFTVDITNHIRMEEELRQSEERYRGLVEATSDIVWNGVAVNGDVSVPAWREFTGQTEDQARINWADAVHPQDRRRVVVDWSHFIQNGGVYKTAYRVRRRDGEYRWLGVTGVSLRGKDGQIREFVGTFSDITERKQNEEAVRVREAMLQGILDNLQDAYFRADLSGRFTIVSPSAARMWGYESHEEIIGMPAAAFYRDEQSRQALLEQLQQTGSLTDWVSQARRKDGSCFWMSLNVQFVRDEQGQITGTEGVVRDITERKRLENELFLAKERLREEKLYLEREINTELGFQEIIGNSEALRSVLENVATVASTDATVLLLGETGTGKELVARAVHRRSQRAGNAFIKMNCAAIPTGLLESELFGAEKGAYTGAIARKIGRLELADQGTLFLDEIGEIAIALQPKLLRVLQDQEFERLGGTQTLKVNFRLIAATNRNLSDEVRNKNFRRDLYYRLNVFPIWLPPLRERRDDIPLLVEYFVQKSARREKKSINSIPKRTMDALQGYGWPGNIRELENFIERSVILSNGSVLAAPISELEAHAAQSTAPAASLTFIDVQRQSILDALRESQGKVSRAASQLGLKRTTLQSKMKQLGIDPRVPTSL